jgi:hypothetical protein
MSKRVKFRVPKNTRPMHCANLIGTMHALRLHLDIIGRRYETITSDGYAIVGVRIPAGHNNIVSYWLGGYKLPKCEESEIYRYIPVYRWRHR